MTIDGMQGDEWDFRPTQRIARDVGSERKRVLYT